MKKYIAALLLGATCTDAAVAAPYVPAADDVVLEQLPLRASDPVAREIRELRSQLSADPANLRLALQLARSYFAQAGAQSDPRYVGYAQAALKPWWDLPQPPVGVLVMRATLRQYGHDFAGAVADIDRALMIEPAHIEALSLRADINLVQADYAASRADCERMAPHVTMLTDAGCIAFIDGMTGRARQSHDRLLAALARTKNVAADQQLWILTRLAEMAWRLNEPRLAEEHFRRAFALKIDDGFLLAAYADFLLDYGRPQDVINLLKDWARADPLLLRLTLAEQALKAPAFAGHQATLSARYAAARMRGDTTHEQEESRFTLQVLNRPEEALKLALSNWRVQREPRDARVVIEAAIALGRADAAQPVLEWMARTGIEDWYLRQLAAKLPPAAVVK
jgi:Tfp pilus assembly protein PilF